MASWTSALRLPSTLASSDDVLAGRDGHRILGQGRSGGKRQQSSDAENGEEHVSTLDRMCNPSALLRPVRRTGRSRMQQRPHADVKPQVAVAIPFDSMVHPT